MLCIFFVKRQPLKSRGVIPFVALISHFIYYLCQIPYFIFSLEWRISYLCYIFLIQYAALQSSYILIPVTFFRYLMIINLNKQKINLSKSSDFPFMLRVLNFLVRRPVSILFSALYFIICISIQLIIAGKNQFRCTLEFYSITNIIFSSFTLFIISIILLLQIYDVYKQWNKFIYCQFSKLFVSGDPFFFRFEQISIFLLIPLFSMANFARFSNITNMIINSIIYYWLLFIQVGFVLTITIFRTLKNCRKKKRNGRELLGNKEVDNIMNNPELREIFLKFSKGEWSAENVILWENLQKFKQIIDPVKKIQFVKYIYNDFLTPNAPFEVNILESTKEQIYDDIEKQNIHEEIFNQIEIEIYMNLMDILQRFKETNSYNLFVTNEKIQYNLLYEK